MPDDLDRQQSRDSSPTTNEHELAQRSSGEHGKVTKLKTNKARQGLLGTPVLMVLIAALVLVAIAWWGAEIYGDAIAPENPSGGAAEPAPD